MTATVDFVRPDGRIYGRASEAGEPVVGARLDAYEKGSAGPSVDSVRAVTDDDGRYEVAGASSGT